MMLEGKKLYCHYQSVVDMKPIKLEKMKSSKLVSILLLISISIVSIGSQELPDPVPAPENPVPIWKGKRYELRKTEKYDEFLTEIGILVLTSYFEL